MAGRVRTISKFAEDDWKDLRALDNEGRRPRALESRDAISGDDILRGHRQKD